MNVKTGRFGEITIGCEEIIFVPQGILGFPEFTKFCLVDPGDDTLILWLQSIENPNIAFAVLEPKIFKADYTVRLSAAELRELKFENVNQSAVFSILTIPQDITQMMANLKAPVVINLKEQIAKQVVLQENEFSIKHPMFKELRTHLMTIQAQKRVSQRTEFNVPVAIKNIPPSLTVKSIQA
ncbi:MAG: flagellar assembly protein FliW [Bdellovibrionota bacterium]